MGSIPMKTLTIGENVFEIVDEQARNNIETLNNTLENMVVEETDPTVPAWAKEATKPTYTAAEVGARPNTWTPSASDVGALPDTTKIPTKTSDLTNDSGFLTQHQSLADYAKKFELPTDLADLTGDSTHRTVTDAEKNTWNAKSDFSGSYNDLTNKPTIPSKTSQLTNDSGFLTSVPSEYVTETELESKGYSTFSGSYDDLADKPTIPSLDGYATETYVTGYAQPKGNYLTEVPSEYVTETELDAKNYLTEHQDLSAYAKTADIPTNVSELTNDSGYLTSIPSEYVTETELTTKGYALQIEVDTLSGEIADLENTKANASDLNNKLPKNQGAENVGKILVVGTDGNLTLTDMPEGGASGDVVGNVDESNNILLSGELADGTYTLKYENEDGTYTEIGTLTVGVQTYINLADPTSDEWKLGYRISSTLNGTSALTGGAITNIIAVSNGDTVRCKGINFTDSNNRICLAKADDSNVGLVVASTWATSNHMSNVTYDANSFTCTINNSEATQIRFSGLLTGTSEDVIITVNQPITD